MKPSDILALIEEFETFKPFILKGIDALASLAPELKPHFMAMNEFASEQRLRTLRKYEEAGFTRDQAIILTIDQNIALQTLLRNSMNKSKQ